MEHFALNQQLFQFIYAGAAPTHWQLVIGMFAAKYLIYIYPIFLAYQWLVHPNRRGLVYMTVIALILALGGSYVFGLFYPVARPFVDGVGINYLPHSADYSFPSDHLTLAATVAFCFMTQAPRWQGFLLLIIGFVIAWGRIFMGVHYPLDMAGALVLSLIATYICVLGKKIFCKKKI